HTQSVIDGAIEDGRVAKELSILKFKVPHLFNGVDALGRVQNFEKKARALEPQIHQSEIDIVITARGGLQRISRALLPLQARSHLGKLGTRTAVLAITPPVDFLQFAQELRGALDVARDRARLHVSDPLPRFGVMSEVVFVCAFGLYQRAGAPV